MDNDNYIIFAKTIKDLLNDLLFSFPDLTENVIKNNINYINIINYDYSTYINDEKDNNNEKEKENEEEEKENEEEIKEDNSEYVVVDDVNKIKNDEFLDSVKFIYNHSLTIFPSNFFDILYQNNDIFEKNESLYFLPDIDFCKLYLDKSISDNTKDAIWKYLQLILFTIIPSIENKNSFGSNEKLFEAIDSNVFRDKLVDTVKEMENLFNSYKNTKTENTQEKDDEDNQNNEDNEDNEDEEKKTNLPDPSTIHEHINKLINGKLGSLAQEIANEVMVDMDIDPENIENPQDLFKKLFKDPSKLISLTKTVTSKLDKKMKDGSIKESEILQEVKEMIDGMGAGNGLGNFNDILRSMGMDKLMPKGGKMNTNAFQNMMDQNIKYSKMKERMKKKCEDKKQNETNYDTNNLNELNNNLANLMKEMQTLNNDDYLNDIFKQQNINGGVSKSSKKKKKNKK